MKEKQPRVERSKEPGRVRFEEQCWSNSGANCFLQLLSISVLISQPHGMLWVSDKLVSPMWSGLAWQIICATFITDSKPRASVERPIIDRVQNTGYRAETGHVTWTEEVLYIKAKGHVTWIEEILCVSAWCCGRRQGDAESLGL